MGDTVVIIGTFDVEASDRDRAQALFAMMNYETRKEAGCVHYAFSTDLADPARFHLSEVWRDAGALQSHMATPHMAEFVTVLGDLVCHRQITRWNGEQVALD